MIDHFPTGGVRTIIVMATCLSALVLLSCAGLKRPPEASPEAAVEPLDPLSGDWQGSWVSDDGETGSVVAQVIALGNGRYRANLLPEFNRRYSSVPAVEGQRSGTAVRFSGEIDVSNWDVSGVVKQETKSPPRKNPISGRKYSSG